MSGGFLDDDAQGALRDAITRIESVSAAEVVLAVRRRSASWFHANVIVGVVTAFAALAFMLFSAHPFGLIAILVDPFIAGGLLGGLTSLVPPVQRLLTPVGAHATAVRRAALVTFHERGIRNTRRRTGLLVYVSIHERLAEVVVDTGIEKTLDAAPLRKLEAALVAAMPAGGVALARVLGDFAPVLAGALPRRDDDVNELPDAIDNGVRLYPRDQPEEF